MDFPTDLKYSKNHTWVNAEDDIAQIGITEYLAEELGEIVSIDLPEEGDFVTADEVFTEIEGSNTTIELVSPLSGEVVAINDEIDESPYVINEDAFSAWIIEIKLDYPTEVDDLLDAESYEELCD